jgi:hypothetical protein
MARRELGRRYPARRRAPAVERLHPQMMVSSELLEKIVQAYFEAARDKKVSAAKRLQYRNGSQARAGIGEVGARAGEPEGGGVQA